MNICLVCCVCIFLMSVGILLLNFLKCQLRIPFLGRTIVSLTNPLLIIHLGFSFLALIQMLWASLGRNLVQIQSCRRGIAISEGKLKYLPAFGTHKPHQKGSLIQVILNSLSVQTYKIKWAFVKFSNCDCSWYKRNIKRARYRAPTGKFNVFPHRLFVFTFWFCKCVCIFSFFQEQLIFPKMLEGKSLPHTKQNESFFFFLFCSLNLFHLSPVSCWNFLRFEAVSVASLWSPTVS